MHGSHVSRPHASAAQHALRPHLTTPARSAPARRRSMSGIFRDSFQNVVELLDDCFQVRGRERQ